MRLLVKSCLLGSIIVALCLVKYSGYQPARSHDETPLSVPVTSELSLEQLHPQSISSTPDKKIGYATLNEEINFTALPIKGTIPTWLKGTLLRTGPAQFELGKNHFKYWFDGFAMLYKFNFNDGVVSYANKFLQSTYYTDALKQGKLPAGLTDQAQKSSFFSKISTLLSPRPIYDNANVNISCIDHQCVALTEAPIPVAFDHHNLRTFDSIEFDDKLEGHVITAHPHHDPISNEYFNIMTEFGKTSTYHLIKMKKNSKKRELICSIPTKHPSYIHSFAMTDHYAIITAMPFIVNPYDLLVSSKPFLENFSWKPERGTEFIVIDRHHGTLVGTFKTKPCFIMHHVNAYEKNNTIIIDAITYQNSDVIEQTMLEKLRDPDQKKSPSQLSRFTLNLKENTVMDSVLYKDSLELPRISYEHSNGKEYQHVYAVSGNDTHVLKINVTNNKSIMWHEQGCYPGEPVVVPHPHDQSKDVVLSVVLDAKKQQSFLLVLDAKTFKELARAFVPHHIPFGFHGIFIPES